MTEGNSAGEIREGNVAERRGNVSKSGCEKDRKGGPAIRKRRKEKKKQQGKK
jgi:hypothetical protein